MQNQHKILEDRHGACAVHVHAVDHDSDGNDEQGALPVGSGVIRIVHLVEVSILFESLTSGYFFT